MDSDEDRSDALQRHFIGMCIVAVVATSQGVLLKLAQKLVNKLPSKIACAQIKCLSF